MHQVVGSCGQRQPGDPRSKVAAGLRCQGYPREWEDRSSPGGQVFGTKTFDALSRTARDVGGAATCVEPSGYAPAPVPGSFFDLLTKATSRNLTPLTPRTSHKKKSFSSISSVNAANV